MIKLLIIPIIASCLISCSSTTPSKDLYELDNPVTFAIEIARSDTNFFGKGRIDDRIFSRDYDDGYKATTFWYIENKIDQVAVIKSATDYCSKKGGIPVKDNDFRLQCNDTNNQPKYNVYVFRGTLRNTDGTFNGLKTQVLVVENTKNLQAERYEYLYRNLEKIMRAQWAKESTQ